MLISEIMTSKPVTVYLDTELRLIKEIFDHVHFHHLLVENEEDQTLAGIISDRDLRQALSPYIDTSSEQQRDAATLKKQAHQIMTREIASVSPQTACDHAARMLLDANISCLPVLSAAHTIIGIVTWKDLLHSYIQE